MWSGASGPCCGLPCFLGQSPVMLQALWAAPKGEGWDHLCPGGSGWPLYQGAPWEGKRGPWDGDSLTNSL